MSVDPWADVRPVWGHPRHYDIDVVKKARAAVEAQHRDEIRELTNEVESLAEHLRAAKDQLLQFLRERSDEQASPSTPSPHGDDPSPASVQAHDAQRFQRLQMENASLNAKIAQLRTQAFGWQPIETAPKDGTQPFIVWFGSGTPDLVGGWHECEEIRELSGGEDTATHWMPVPAPPSDQETKDRPA